MLTYKLTIIIIKSGKKDAIWPHLKIFFRPTWKSFCPSLTTDCVGLVTALLGRISYLFIFFFWNYLNTEKCFIINQVLEVNLRYLQSLVWVFKEDWINGFVQISGFVGTTNLVQKNGKNISFDTRVISSFPLKHFYDQYQNTNLRANLDRLWRHWKCFYRFVLVMLGLMMLVGIYYAIRNRNKETMDTYYFGGKNMSPVLLNI